MRFLLLVALLGCIVLITAKPAFVEDKEEPTNILLDFADAGDFHSNDGDRQARHWGGGGYGGGGWGGGGYGGGGWGGGGYGGGGYGGWGGHRGGWGGHRWGGGGYGGGGWGGGWRKR